MPNLNIILICLLTTINFAGSLLAQTKPKGSINPKPKQAIQVSKIDTGKIKKGVIVITEDSGIAYIVNNFPLPVEAKRTLQGYRIQVISTTSRQLANDTKAKVMDKYPEFRASELYQSPYFKIRIGDFEDYVTAQAAYRKIHKQFPTAFIVPDVVTIYR